MNTQNTHPNPAVRMPGWIRLTALTLIVVSAIAGLTVLGLRARANQLSDRDISVTSSRSDKPRVLTVKADRAPAFVDQVLPGNAAPYLETAIYSRTTGYLKRRLVDIGDKVQAGQLLAEIESPEIDAQLLQALATLNESRATLERSKANEALAQANLNRVDKLTQTNSGSKQEFDEADASLKVAKAAVRVADATIVANQAAVRRLEELQKFQKVTAPFSGVVTARNFDTGALIVADSSAARELFHISQNDTLRIFADVPQIFATSIRNGQQASVFRREKLGVEFQGVVTRTTNSVDTHTRTLRVEVEVPNPKGDLLPGMYLQVRFRFDSPSDAVRVPGAAVITRAEGSKIAFVDDQGAIRYRAVTLGRDFGSMIEVISGLHGGEQLAIRPGDDMPDGTLVEAVSASGSTTP